MHNSNNISTTTFCVKLLLVHYIWCFFSSYFDIYHCAQHNRLLSMLSNWEDIPQYTIQITIFPLELRENTDYNHIITKYAQQCSAAVYATNQMRGHVQKQHRHVQKSVGHKLDFARKIHFNNLGEPGAPSCKTIRLGTASLIHITQHTQPILYAFRIHNNTQ